MCQCSNTIQKSVQQKYCCVPESVFNSNLRPAQRQEKDWRIPDSEPLRCQIKESGNHDIQQMLEQDCIEKALCCTHSAIILVCKFRNVSDKLWQSNMTTCVQSQKQTDILLAAEGQPRDTRGYESAPYNTATETNIKWYMKVKCENSYSFLNWIKNNIQPEKPFHIIFFKTFNLLLFRIKLSD